MAAPVAAHVKLPDDTANAGKKMRTQSRLVGADTVHEHLYGPISRRSKLGVYHYAPALQSVVQTAQDGIATGFLWLVNPTGASVDVVLKRLAVMFNGTVAANTSARLLLSRFTYTGTPSGATVAPAKRKTADAGNVGVLYTASTGMTVTLVATVFPFMIPALISASGVFPTVAQRFPDVEDPFEDDDLVLVPGEGVVLWQADAGIASDTRRFTVGLLTEEIER